MNLNWLRRLLEVPIPETKCNGCEAYREALAHERYEKEKLLAYILEPKEEMQPANIQIEEPEPIVPKIIPWEVRRRMLEEEDRQKAVLLKQQRENVKQAIEDLEDRLNVKPLDLSGGKDVQSSTIEADGGSHQQEKGAS